MAFTRHTSLDAHGAPVLRKATIGNSVTITELDSVKFSSGYVALGTAGAAVLGHVLAIVTKNDVGLNTDGSAGSEIGSFSGTYTTASDNTSDAKVAAKIDVSQATLYSAEVDADLGTTTGSDLAGYRMDLVDEDTLDESTATTNSAQYVSWGVDPNDSSRVICSILESSVFNS